MTKLIKICFLVLLPFLSLQSQAHEEKKDHGPEIKAEGLMISDVWARAGKPNSAVFMTIINTTDKPVKIVSASAEGVAKRVELHDHLWEDSTMKMRKVESIKIPAKQQMKLRPGGKHVMLFDVGEGLKKDQQFELKLTLADGKTVSLEVPVKSMKYRDHKKDHGKGKHAMKSEECPCDAKKTDKPCPCPKKEEHSSEHCAH